MQLAPQYHKYLYLGALKTFFQQIDVTMFLDFKSKELKIHAKQEKTQAETQASKRDGSILNTIKLVQGWLCDSIGSNVDHFVK